MTADHHGRHPLPNAHLDPPRREAKVSRDLALRTPRLRAGTTREGDHPTHHTLTMIRVGNIAMCAWLADGSIWPFIF